MNSAPLQPTNQPSGSTSPGNPGTPNNASGVTTTSVAAPQLQEDTPPAQNYAQADPLVEAAREFWRERARALVSDSPKAIDDAARQVLTVAGVIVGFYVNAVVRADFQTRVHDWWSKLFYISPVLVLLVSIGFGLWVFFPGVEKININSSTAGKLMHDLLVERKERRLRWASIWLVIGILVLCAALLAYFLGDNPGSST